MLNVKNLELFVTLGNFYVVHNQKAYPKYPNTQNKWSPPFKGLGGIEQDNIERRIEERTYMKANTKTKNKAMERMRRMDGCKEGQIESISPSNLYHSLQLT